MSCLPAPLPSPPPDEVAYASFGVSQTGALEVCNDRRAVAVEAMDLHNLFVDRLTADIRPPSFWERVWGKKLPEPTLNDVIEAR